MNHAFKHRYGLVNFNDTAAVDAVSIESTTASAQLYAPIPSGCLHGAMKRSALNSSGLSEQARGQAPYTSNMGAGGILPAALIGSFRVHNAASRIELSRLAMVRSAPLLCTSGLPSLVSCAACRIAQALPPRNERLSLTNEKCALHALAEVLHTRLMEFPSTTTDDVGMLNAAGSRRRRASSDYIPKVALALAATKPDVLSQGEVLRDWNGTAWNAGGGHILQDSQDSCQGSDERWRS